MSATEFLQSGQLPEALAALQQQVRREPGDARLRIFLFQLLAVMGDLERAGAQLEVAGQLDAGALLMVQMYREALRCEVFRREVFAGRRTPLLFGEPSEWLALLIESFRHFAQGEFSQAEELRNKAFEAAPPSPGRLTTADKVVHSFEWLADSDSRLGPVVEAVVQGKYYWIPLSRISRIVFEPPTDLRDCIWAVANFTWTTGGESLGMLPARYLGSESSPDGLIRLGRRTEWAEVGGGTPIGQGQKMLASDVGEFALLDIRDIEFDNPAESPPTPEQTAPGTESPAPHG